MRYRKRNSKLKLLMILVIGISIGYALLSTTLKIDGVVIGIFIG